jgi:hypothetical protein
VVETEGGEEAVKLSLREVEGIALCYVPTVARWRGNMMEIWGPAHEIGHLLVAKPKQVRMPDFGLGPPQANPKFKARVYELAASIIHTWILVACGSHEQAHLTWEEGPPFIQKKRWVGLKPHAYALLEKRGIKKKDVQHWETLDVLCRRAREAAYA